MTNPSFFISSESIAQRNQILDEHRQVIMAMRAVERDIERFLRENSPYWKELEQKRNALYVQIEPLIEKYWDWISPVNLSRCPFCNADLFRRFDPVDLKGFWWMPRTQRERPEPKSCEHFQLLQGAVNRNGHAFDGGLFECKPGPEIPFVIPRILEFPTMVAVIFSLSMHCGYTAYPIAYFSEVPHPPRSLTQSWAQPEYHFTMPDGRSGWDIIEDSYDFDLGSWISKGKVKSLVAGFG